MDPVTFVLSSISTIAILGNGAHSGYQALSSAGYASRLDQRHTASERYLRHAEVLRTNGLASRALTYELDAQRVILRPEVQRKDSETHPWASRLFLIGTVGYMAFIVAAGVANWGFDERLSASPLGLPFTVLLVAGTASALAGLWLGYQGGKRVNSEVNVLLASRDEVTAVDKIAPMTASRPHAPDPLTGPRGAIVAANRQSIWRVLHEYGVANAQVFGSAARGDDSPESDIDLMVDFPPGTTLIDIAELKHRLEDLLGGPVDLVPANDLKNRVRKSAEPDLVAL